MYHVTSTPVKPLLVTVSINNASVEMEVDTGASVSIISEATYNHLWSPEDAPPPGIQYQTLNIQWRTDRCQGVNFCHCQVQGAN